MFSSRLFAIRVSYIGCWYVILGYAPGGNWPLRVAGAFRQKPFRFVYATARGGRVSPGTVPSGSRHPPIGQALHPAPVMHVGGILLLVGHASAAILVMIVPCF
jgi:hypothetical protein